LERTASEVRDVCQRALYGDLFGQAEFDIDEGQRTVAGVLPHLDRLGLSLGMVAEYRAWLTTAHERAQVFA